MKYYVAEKGNRNGNGSQENPFQRIGDAAEIAQAGDEIIVMPGIYRESVNPKNGGTKSNAITYRSAEIGAAIITGAEEVKTGKYILVIRGGLKFIMVFSAITPHIQPLFKETGILEPLYITQVKST